MGLKHTSSYIAAAVALALSGVAGAQTFTPPVDGNNNLLDISGSTATDGVIIAAMIGTDSASICDGTQGVPDIYTTEAALTFGVTTANYEVVCVAKTSLGLSGGAGAVYAVRKFSGGSGSGIGNVASGVAVGNDAVNDRNWVSPVVGAAPLCQAAAGNPQSPGGGLNNYNLFLSCQPDGAAIKTKGGISDEEPALLGATPTQLGQLTQNAGIAVDFAPVISTPLFATLQTAEHITVHAVDDGPNMPNLSSTQIAGILNGKITASNFMYANPAGDTGAATTLPNSPSGSATIFLCRRGNSSGTETGFGIHYLAQGCGTAGVGDPNLSVVAATTPACTASGCGWNSATYGTDRVFAGTGSADVIACMNYHSTQNQYAVGVLTTEYAPGAGAAYAHVKVDGVQPSIENQAIGAWSFFTEDSFNTPNSTAPNFPNVTGDQALLTTAILTAFKAPALLAVALIPQGAGGVAWYGGSLAIPSSIGATFTPQGTNSLHAAVKATPVGTATHSQAYGGALNNCNPSWTGGRSLVPVDSPNF